MSSRPHRTWSGCEISASSLSGPHQGVWFYLYTIWDLWSRKTVGWCVDTTETADIAHKLINVTARHEHVERHQLIIHSDRGAQMTSGTLIELYDSLGVCRSLSRPRLSNDNPHAEAGFKTVKYRPDWPVRLATIEDAISHCERFFAWHNDDHHSGIGLPTQNDRRNGNGAAINAAHQTVLDAAHGLHPERFKQVVVDGRW